MEHIKMAVLEEKGSITYNFSYGYENRARELEWVPNVVTARRGNDSKWSFEYHAVKSQDLNQLETYRKMLEKVVQVVETNGANLHGITIEKGKVPVKE
ncbi:MAG: hypothetical protein HQK96_20435 [Nitrospirae bacterium]|nr:hypothetical protein [Nitrospirota bacterium]